MQGQHHNSYINEFSVLTWNCLADCYAQGSFAKRLNDYSILHWKTRFESISRAIRHQNADIICLQEVDHYQSQYKPFLLSINYTPVYVQRAGRGDGVLIAAKTSKFEILAKDVVQFDDLALLASSSVSETQRSRFRKQNVALILLLAVKPFAPLSIPQLRPRSFTIANTHLYWNPILPQIKLAQTRYLLERITFVRCSNGQPPSASILVGDFNSLPNSEIYTFVQKGFSFPTLSGKCRAGAVDKAHCEARILIQNNGARRFMCDGSLNRLARMLRLLGLDATVETDESGCKWSREKIHSVFARARAENRVLVTTRAWLLKRAECPETFLIKSAERKTLEECLAALLNHYDVKLDKNDILSACAKCGGSFQICSFDDPRLYITQQEVPKDRQLLICVRCFQVYWQSGSSNGPSAKALRTAERLFTIVQKARRDTKATTKRICTNEISNDEVKDCTCFHSVSSVTQERQVSDKGVTVSAMNSRKHQHWLKYYSAFSNCNGKEPECTNINGEFRGTLDYIFLAGTITALDVVVVNCVSGSTDNNHKSYPNNKWPSDHMMLKAIVRLGREAVARPGFSRSTSALF